MTVRAQDASALRSIAQDTFGGDIPERLTLEYGEIPYEKLWTGHDVLVAPEKLNGLSLPLQEAWAAGMMVMTTDRYPMNTWLPTPPLIPVARTERASMGGHLEFDESIVEPAAIAAKIDEWYGKDIWEISHKGKWWAREMSWRRLKPRFMEALK